MNLVVSRHAARGWEKGLCAMSLTPVGGHPQGWEHKLADRSSLPPASGEEKSKSQSKHVFTQPQLPKGPMQWREETEGSSASSARSPASPPYLRWARTLHDLLEDAEGVRLFRKFVGGAGKLHVDRLNFFFAVQGLRQETDPHVIRQLVSAIYKFLRKSQLAMSEELKLHVKQSLKDGSSIEKTIFDNMEQEVTRAITESTYQAFLRSEAYVSYVSAATQPLSSPDASPPAPSKEVPGPAACLATLHEGQELGPVAGGPAAGAAPARLTHDALLATQSRRLHSDQAPDGLSMRLREPREPRHRPRLHGMDRHAVINKEQDTAMVIPRTQRMQSEQLRVLEPSEFAPLLISKLEKVQRERENKERLERRLAEGDGEDMSSQTLPPQLVAAAIRVKLQVDDDNDQDILDQHVSRVWSERTPGASPPGGRRARPRRRAPSTLSADSGLYDTHSGFYDAHSDRASASRRFSKKTSTELTDSGVSVVSSHTAARAGAAPRLLQWVTEGSERLARQRSEQLSSRASSAERANKPRTKASGSKSSGSGASATSDAPCTVVVVSFLDELVPYRIKVPAAPLTLRTFKEYLPRKGNYRYFFKTECADLDNTVLQEEVSHDAEVLPMFEGKVMARVKSIE